MAVAAKTLVLGGSPRRSWSRALARRRPQPSSGARRWISAPATPSRRAMWTSKLTGRRSAWTAGGEPWRRCAARGEFGPAATLAPDGGADVAVAADGAGGALVAWSQRHPWPRRAHGRGERAHRRRDRRGRGRGSGPDVAFTGPGQALVVWGDVDGAVHALSRTLGGSTVALPDLAAGPGNVTAHVGAAGGHAVAAWTHTATAGKCSPRPSRSSAGCMAPGRGIRRRRGLGVRDVGHEHGGHLVRFAGHGTARGHLRQRRRGRPAHRAAHPGAAGGGRAGRRGRRRGRWASVGHSRTPSPLVDGPSLNSGMYIADVATGLAG